MPAFSGRVPRQQPAPTAAVEVCSTPIEPVKAKAQVETRKRRRARHDDGTYVADNPNTQANEAWISDGVSVERVSPADASEAQSDG